MQLDISKFTRYVLLISIKETDNQGHFFFYIVTKMTKIAAIYSKMKNKIVKPQ